MSLDIGLLVLRALVGFVLYAHAVQKLAGRFHGPGLQKTAAVFEALGQTPGRAMAILAAGCELVAALLLLTGLGTPLGASVAMGTMLVASASMTVKAGSAWNTLGGGEYPLVLAAVAAGLAFTGAGTWSLDAAFAVPWTGLSGSAASLTGAGAVVLAVAAAQPPIVRMRAQRRALQNVTT